MSDLIRISSQPASNDGIHVQALDFVRIFGDKLAQLVPECVVGLALFGNEVLVVHNLGQILSGVVQPVNVHQVGNEVLGVLGAKLKISAEDPNGGLWNSVTFDELDVKRPNPVVLGDGQSPQGTVKDAPRPRDLFLVDQKLAVVHPNPRHLVHEDECPLEGVVDLVEGRIRNATVLDLFPPEDEIVVPELVAARELLEGSLIDDVNLLLGRALLSLDVPLPGLERVRIAEQLLLKRKILIVEHHVDIGVQSLGVQGHG